MAAIERAFLEVVFSLQDVPATEDEWNELEELVSQATFHHPHHMSLRWHKAIHDPDALARGACLEDRCAIIARVGLLTLSGDTGGWRVREAMNRAAARSASSARPT
jgi:hypothetical protein